MKTIAGIIHARKDSTRCPNKHLRPLGNTTLIDVALDKLSQLNLDEKKFIDGIVKINKELQWMDPSNRGYLSLHCMEDKIVASYNYVKELEKINSAIASSKTFILHKEGLRLEETKA